MGLLCVKAVPSLPVAVSWDQQFSAKSEINYLFSIFCWQNLGNIVLSSLARVTLFSDESRKIFKTLELRDSSCLQSSQNLEPLGLAGKILFSKNLAES